jgi:PAS domain S-box-containing protein
MSHVAKPLKTPIHRHILHQAGMSHETSSALLKPLWMLKNRKYFRIFQLRSLKAKMTLFTLGIFLLSIWSLAFYTSLMLREDMKRLLGEQQFSAVSFIASEVNSELDVRLRALEIVAGAITPAMLGNTAAVQSFLGQHTILQSLFNGGPFVTRLDGIASASLPLSAGRAGTDYMDRDYITAALKESKATVGRPVMGRKVPSPIISMAAPIRDVQGKVIGVLAGVTDLGKPNFLDKLTANRYGKTGGYLLVAPQYRLIVAATDKRRGMEDLPAPGINPLIDRFIQDYEGSDVLVNPLGVEVLASAKGVPAAGWFVASQLPTEEAFAPVRAMQQRMLVVTIFLTLLAGSLTWWMLRRQLSPMLAAVRKLATLSDSDQPPQPLPIIRQDEIGQLITGFNRLLETSERRKEALRESEFRWKFAIEGSGEGLWDWNVANNTVFFSGRWKEVLGFSEDELGISLQEWTTRIHPEDKTKTLSTMQDYLDGKTSIYVSEQRVCCKDGSYKWSLNRGLVVSRSDDDKPLRMIGTHSDITERKKTELALREKTNQLHMLSRRILETQETERRRVAHELHDELGQALTAIKINLQMRERLQKHSPDELNTENLRIVDDALQQVRRLALALRPSMLDDLGLLPALRWMAEQSSARSGFTVEFHTSMPEVRLAPEIETACFRIVQESLTNIARHAQAQLVQIELHRTCDALMLCVRDDGCGFDLAAMRGRAVAGGSIGVLGMQERAELIGGQLDIESTPGQGSTVRLRCPLRRRGEAA